MKPNPPADSLVGTRPGRALRTLALAAGLWTAIGLFFACQFYFSSSLTNRPVTWGSALGHALGDWYVWAILSMLPIRLAQLVPLEGANWQGRAALHLLASLAVAALYAALRAVAAQIQGWLVGDLIPFLDLFQPLLLKTYFFNLMVYWVILSLAHAARFYRQYHQRERMAAELARSLTEARLQALQTQLNPHFLFNALHSISALMHRDVEAADSMLARLSELLRLTMKRDGAQLIPLGQELEILERYLDIERVRFGDRLRIEVDIDPTLRDALVPPLMLQPLAENALKHGIAPYAKAGTLTIAARRVADNLALEVRDNGGGLSAAPKQGIGISNTRSRLESLFPNRHQFSIDNHPEGGVAVQLSIPYCLSAPPVSSP